MNVNELIHKLEGIRREYGGELSVRIMEPGIASSEDGESDPDFDEVELFEVDVIDFHSGGSLGLCDGKPTATDGPNPVRVLLMPGSIERLGGGPGRIHAEGIEVSELPRKLNPEQAAQRKTLKDQLKETVQAMSAEFESGIVHDPSKGPSPMAKRFNLLEEELKALESRGEPDFDAAHLVGDITPQGTGGKIAASPTERSSRTWLNKLAESSNCDPHFKEIIEWYEQWRSSPQYPHYEMRGVENPFAWPEDPELERLQNPEVFEDYNPNESFREGMQREWIIGMGAAQKSLAKLEAVYEILESLFDTILVNWTSEQDERKQGFHVQLRTLICILHTYEGEIHKYLDKLGDLRPDLENIFLKVEGG